MRLALVLLLACVVGCLAEPEPPPDPLAAKISKPLSRTEAIKRFGAPDHESESYYDGKHYRTMNWGPYAAYTPTHGDTTKYRLSISFEGEWMGSYTRGVPGESRAKQGK